jgi:phosphate transport system substrate-binding protein
MNDDFLHRLRTEPSPKFLAALKASLDRQAIRQNKARRTVFRTAILAALIGGSAVAVAFVAWRGIPLKFGTLAHVSDAPMERSASAKHIISVPDGGGASRGVAAALAPEPVPAPTAGGATVTTPAAATSPSSTVIKVAGVSGIISNVENFARFPISRGIFEKPELTQTTAAQAIAMLCHVRGSAGAASVTADVAGLDRRISATELATCKRNGVMRVTELRPGYEAVVLVRSKLYGAPKLSARDIFLALAARVPDLPNRPYFLIKNPYHVWNAIDSALSEEQIEVLGPPVPSATASVFRQTVMEAGCLTFPALAILKESNPEQFDKVCHAVREDGIYRDLAQVSTMASHLDTYPNALALLKYRDMADNSAVAAASIDGVDPSSETIIAGSYVGSRAMYLYVNSARVGALRPLFDFVLGFERSASDRFSDTTLVGLDPAERQTDIQNAMTLPDVKL